MKASSSHRGSQKVGPWITAMISTRVPNTLPQGREDHDVPTFWLLLEFAAVV